jgi:hypothetical protein
MGHHPKTFGFHVTKGLHHNLRGITNMVSDFGADRYGVSNYNLGGPILNFSP